MNTPYPTLNHGLDEELNMLRDTVYQFCQKELAPRATDIDRNNEFPMDLWPKLGALGVLGMTVDEAYGGTNMGYLAHAIVMEEISRASAAVGLSFGAHSNLCLNQIQKNGTPRQREQYLPKLCSGEHIGALAMSEPSAGSDVVSMKLKAEKRGDKYVLNGNKMWITNGSVADVAVIWAQTEEGIRGFCVPTKTAGLVINPIKHKLSLRASITSELVFNDMRVPDSARLPEATSLRAPLLCLAEARYGIIFGTVGAARDCFEVSLAYATTREQFDGPISKHQLTQAKFADMATKITTSMLLAYHLADLKDAGKILPEQISMGKFHNVNAALEIARSARSILGGAGITSEYSLFRHMSNLETVLTYEGTHEIHMLVLGQALTGIAAFR